MVSSSEGDRSVNRRVTPCAPPPRPLFLTVHDGHLRSHTIEDTVLNSEVLRRMASGFCRFSSCPGRVTAISMVNTVAPVTPRTHPTIPPRGAEKEGVSFTQGDAEREQRIEG